MLTSATSLVSADQIWVLSLTGRPWALVGGLDHRRLSSAYIFAVTDDFLGFCAKSLPRNSMERIEDVLLRRVSSPLLLSRKITIGVMREKQKLAVQVEL